MINVKTANLRALGFAVDPPPGQPDGIISVNTAITSPGSPGSTGMYNLLPVVLHEIDEVLGLGSSLPSIPDSTIFPEDLYRYSATNTRTFTASDSRTSGVSAYFSIDAMTFLAEFDNENDGGDFGDWQEQSPPGRCRRESTRCVRDTRRKSDMSVELTALDVIGYDRATSIDVGTVGLPGNASQSGGTWTVSGSGSDIWGTSDSFQFVYVTSSMTSAIEARVMDLQDTNPFAKAGVMLRASSAAGSATIILDVRHDGALEYMARYQDGSAMNFITGLPAGSLTFPVSLRLNWVNGRVSPWFSQDGVNWDPINASPAALELAPPYYAGLAVTSHDTSRVNVVHADALSLGAIPVEIGDVGIVGDGAVDQTQPNFPITIEAAGADTWGMRDSFAFVPVSAGDMIAYRVVGLNAANPFAKAGVMYRDGLLPNAVNVIFDAKPDGSVEFLARRCAGCNTEYLGGTQITFPTYLMLTRSGSTYTASVSTTDPAHSTPIGSVDLSMTDSRPGLAVTSHDPTALALAVFDTPPQ